MAITVDAGQLVDATLTISMRVQIGDNPDAAIVVDLSPARMPFVKALEHVRGFANACADILDAADTDGEPVIVELAPVTPIKRAKPAADATAAPTVCDVPGCSKPVNGKQGLLVHKARSHKTDAAPKPPPVDPGDVAMLLRCAEDDCDVAMSTKAVAKFRSHIHTAHGRSPSRDEMTPRIEISEAGGGSASSSR